MMDDIKGAATSDRVFHEDIIPGQVSASKRQYEVLLRWKLRIPFSSFLNFFFVCLLVAFLSQNYLKLAMMRDKIEALEVAVQKCLSEPKIFQHSEHEIDTEEPLAFFESRAMIESSRLKRSAKGGKRDGTSKGKGAGKKRQNSKSLVDGTIVKNTTIAAHFFNHKLVGWSRVNEIVDWYDTGIAGLHNDTLRLDSRKRTVTVDVPGLYWIYSQVYYFRLDREGAYTICLNSTAFPIPDGCKVIARCVTSGNRGDDGDSSCFTGAAAWLRVNDQIFIEYYHLDRQISYAAANTFFGLVRIGD